LNRFWQFLKNNRNNHGSSPWALEYYKFEPGQEKLREALCTLGNGYLGTRGAFNEVSASRIHYPGTYLAGVYNKLESDIAGKTISNEDLVNCPNWLSLTFKTDESQEWFIPSVNHIVSYYQKLDLKEASLIRNYRIQDDSGKITTIETRRIAHMGNKHIVAQEYTIVPENYEGELIIRSAIDGNIENKGVERYSDLESLHLRAGKTGNFSENGIYLTVTTNQSEIEIAMASATNILNNGVKVKPVSTDTKKEEKAISQEFKIRVSRGERYVIEKIVAIYTSQDKEFIDPLKDAMALTEQNPGFSSLFDSHKEAWSNLWDLFDIETKGHIFSQKTLRLHIFHLLQTASIHNSELDVGIPARGLSGEAYRGHIFWDEVFILPLYNFRLPEITKSTLLYRYRRLEQAREYARENGYQGAMFPWQSSSTGEEETQIIHLNPKSGKWGPDYSRNQRHVSFAIAYCIWEHWRIAQDLDFMLNYGAELFLSIAQFAASLSYFDSEDQRYHTRGLMGPDEFHERLPGAIEAGFKDNAYSNILIVWTLRQALEILSSILSAEQKESLLKKLNIEDGELETWSNITRKMNIVIDKKGIISQFDGYFSLQELNWKAYRRKYGNIQRMDRILKAEGKSTNDYKVAKQADTLMLPFLFSLSELETIFKQLGYQFNKKFLRKNYDYYVQRTSHGSTLSKVVHCYLSDILGKSRQSWRWYCEVLNSDINDIQGGTTPEGIHTGVMGGSINIAMKRYAGVDVIGGIINIGPDIPKKWKYIKFKIKYNEIWYSLLIERYKIVVTLSTTKLVSDDYQEKIKICQKEYLLNLNKTYTFSIV
jgi:trehalose/maltose hydrolase-like predicted phosphorylase